MSKVAIVVELTLDEIRNALIEHAGFLSKVNDSKPTGGAHIEFEYEDKGDGGLAGCTISFQRANNK
jgi:hypothetical protein